MQKWKKKSNLATKRTLNQFRLVVSSDQYFFKMEPKSFYLVFQHNVDCFVYLYSGSLSSTRFDIKMMIILLSNSSLKKKEIFKTIENLQNYLSRPKDEKKAIMQVKYDNTLLATLGRQTPTFISDHLKAQIENIYYFRSILFQLLQKYMFKSWKSIYCPSGYLLTLTSIFEMKIIL